MMDGCWGGEEAREGAGAVVSDSARAPAAGGVVGMGGVDSCMAVVFGSMPQNYMAETVNLMLHK